MYVYIIECEDSSFYTGIAKDLKKRLVNHGNGSRYTRAKKPVKLVYVELPENAYKREPQIKKLSRKKKEALINSDFNIVEQFIVLEVS